MYKFENEENRPDNCEECVHYETCATLFGGYICQKKWRKKEKVEEKDGH